MKSLKTTIILVLAVFCVTAVNAVAIEKENVKNDKAEVYYFHNTRRCPTCMAIEKETKKVLNETFSEDMESGTIVFKSYNAEEKENKDLVKKMGVTGSALIVVKGDKTTDLTNKGFMYALKQPEKLREALIEVLQED